MPSTLRRHGVLLDLGAVVDLALERPLHQTEKVFERGEHRLNQPIGHLAHLGSYRGLVFPGLVVLAGFFCLFELALVLFDLLGYVVAHNQSILHAN